MPLCYLGLAVESNLYAVDFKAVQSFGEGYAYESNGMCRPCHHAVRQMLLRSVKRRMKEKPGDRYDLILLRKARVAKKLLRRFPRPARGPFGRLRIGKNPVDEAPGSLPSSGVHCSLEDDRM